MMSQAHVAKAAPRRALYEKVVVVSRRTQLEELTARFNTVAQARFYLEHAGQDFGPIEAAHQQYHAVLDAVRHTVPKGVKSQIIERSFVPQFSFGTEDLVVTVGNDGLVVNVAKYLQAQPILAVNPDPQHIDGVLLPFSGKQAEGALVATLKGEGRIQQVSMAEARLSDGQRMLAFNDLFIGARSHVSARYQLQQGSRTEAQSSSGIIVSTGAGSTGWLQSVYAGAAGVITALGGHVVSPPAHGRLPWDTDHLVYAVREPFPSKTTRAGMVYGTIAQGAPLRITSHMAENGVIFSDGIEVDYLDFNAGATATIDLAAHKARLIA